jgi:sugar phosphate isomerase/epimerase
MLAINRRDFGRLALGGTGVLAAARAVLAQERSSLPPIKSTFNGVVVGCNTYSLSSLPLEDAIKAIADIGFGISELHPCHVEPPFGLRGAGPGPLPPEQQVRGREKLRQWRLTVPLDQFAAISRKFHDAGLYLYAYNMNFSDDLSDAEIDRTFEMTKALGCNLITAVGSSELFRRLDAFARRHKVVVGLHNEGRIRSVADFETVSKGLSDYIAFTLDIGHFAAAGGDSLAMIEKHHDRIVNIHLKDRKKNNGPNMPFGRGNTPIKEVLLMLRDRKYRVPTHIEWEVSAPRDQRIAAVRQCFGYCRQALQS